MPQIMDQALLLRSKDRLIPIKEVGHDAGDKKIREHAVTKDFAANEDRGQQGIGSAAEDGRIAKGHDKLRRQAEQGSQQTAQTGADGKQRRHLSADESGGESENREQRFQDPVIPVNPAAGKSQFHQIFLRFPRTVPMGPAASLPPGQYP